jgi:hypothetical protein
MLTLMTFEDQPPVGYGEGLKMGKIHDTPAAVNQLETLYALALSDAMPLRGSIALLRDTAKDYRRHD